jgi:hypothetical protein
MDAVHIERGPNVGRELVELGVDVDGRGESGGRASRGRRGAIHEVASEAGVVEDAVEIGAPDAPARALGAVELATGQPAPRGDAEERRRRARSARPMWIS